MRAVRRPAVPPAGRRRCAIIGAHGRGPRPSCSARATRSSSSGGTDAGRRSSASSIFVRRADRGPASTEARRRRADGVHTARLGPRSSRSTRRRAIAVDRPHACDGVAEGDYLEPFVAPAVPPRRRTTPGDAGLRAIRASIVFGDERRDDAATGDFMLIDRGSDHGVRAGQRADRSSGRPLGGARRRCDRRRRRATWCVIVERRQTLDGRAIDVGRRRTRDRTSADLVAISPAIDVTELQARALRCSRLAVRRRRRRTAQR